MGVSVCVQRVWATQFIGPVKTIQCVCVCVCGARGGASVCVEEELVWVWMWGRVCVGCVYPLS